MLELVPIAEDHGRVDAGDRDLHLAVPQLQRDELEHVLDHGDEVHRLHLRLTLSREVEEVPYDSRDPVDLIDDDRELTSLGCRPSRRGQQQVGATPDDMKGCADLVRQTRRELSHHRHLLRLTKLSLESDALFGASQELVVRALEPGGHSIELLRHDGELAGGHGGVDPVVQSPAAELTHAVREPEQGLGDRATH